MAGGTHQVEIGNDDLLPPWSTVLDVIEATDINEWVLVGGLMVQLHAHRAEIPPPRATKDVDLVVDVAANGASDVMVADHLPTRIKPRFMMRPAFAVAAGEQSLRRRDTFVVTSTSRTVTLGAPDVLGALIRKLASARRLESNTGPTQSRGSRLRRGNNLTARPRQFTKPSHGLIGPSGNRMATLEEHHCQFK